MATTTNFGWETPDDTDLVKDGAAAIRTALGGVDTSFVDLKGGTTNQFLAKASNTDLDFAWAGSWTSFTPTWQNLTVGNGTGVYKYQQVGKQLFARYKFTLGSTSSVGTNPNVTLPINPASGAGGFSSYTLSLTDSGVGGFNGNVSEDTNKLYLSVGVTSGSFLNGGTITATSPFTFTTGDFISFDVYYEVA